jgi:hypothetical protein
LALCGYAFVLMCACIVQAEAPVVLDGLEWVRLRVCGQSFMLHQIRKMVGMAIAVVRTSADPRVAVPRSLGRERHMVPRAPGTGLFLRQVNYDAYNRRLVRLGQPDNAIDWGVYRVRLVAQSHSVCVCLPFCVRVYAVVHRSVSVRNDTAADMSIVGHRRQWMRLRRHTSTPSWPRRSAPMRTHACLRHRRTAATHGG